MEYSLENLFGKFQFEIFCLDIENIKYQSENLGAKTGVEIHN